MIAELASLPLRSDLTFTQCPIVDPSTLRGNHGTEARYSLFGVIPDLGE